LVEGDITQDHKKQELYLKVKNNLRGRKLGIAVGGPPCQGFSLAGRRLIDDPRNVLFKEFVTIVDKLRPRVFIMENVPGLMSMDEGRAITEIILYFKNLEYVLKDPVILKSENYGVPQKRRRLFILGHLPEVKVDFPPRKLFSEDKNSELPEVATVYDGISDLTPIYTGLGAEKIEIKNWKPRSEYQELMAGCMDFDSFYSARK
ncbi:MAG TPA: DNA cytosine methyltransferase, partial [Candidatus Wunengus sp. YC60]|uniref:DNA cytosine methyltransferase n=1 Tax=Candidatus Wunengus sp. YC60 TaxID=3367697 RepID=UPI0040255A07